MLAITGRCKTGFKKLKRWVPKERNATHSCLRNSNGKVNGLMKILKQFMVMAIL